MSSATSSAPSGVDGVQAIAGRLHRLEALLDDVFATGGDLAALLVRVRAERSLSRVVGHPVDAAVARAMALSSDAMTQVVEAHRLIDKLAPRFGVDPAMYGDGSQDPAGAAASVVRMQAVG